MRPPTFRLTGQSPELLEQQLRAEAMSSVARELVLEAVAAKLGIEITDADIRGSSRRPASQKRRSRTSSPMAAQTGFATPFV